MGNSTDHAASSNQSPLRGALLALLAQGPSYGYELANRLERQLGPSWSIRRTSLYRMLQGMCEEGLIVTESSEEHNPGKIVYRTTQLAGPVLVAWMVSPIAFDEGELQLQARMVVAQREDLPRLLIALDGYERVLFAMRAEIEAGLPARQSLRAAMMFLVREAPIQQINSRLHWVDFSRHTIRDLMAS
jgi:DNA-binding PadR family transcriptional regulator